MGNNCCNSDMTKIDEEFDFQAARGRDNYDKKAKKRSRSKPKGMHPLSVNPQKKKKRKSEPNKFEDLPLYRKSELEDILENMRVVKQGKKIRK